MEKYMSVKDLENAAFEVLPKATRDYYKSGVGDELTLSENRKAFNRLRILPKCMVGITSCDLRTTVLGEEVSMPLGISPTAMQRLAHPDGELANARAAEAEGTIYTLSTIATSSMEEVAEAAPKAIKWWNQVNINNDREMTKHFVRRAERAGFKAIALTVDTPILSTRKADVKNEFTLPQHLKLANYEGLSNKIQQYVHGGSLTHYVQSFLDKSSTWDDVKWLKSITKLPLVAKGILRGDDAVKAAKAGCSAILVSNHGARQLDGVPATIEALPEVIDAVKDYNVEVYLDGGVTSGTDVYKALALGAKMVFVGRPALWGLAVGGQAGVQRMLSIFRTELEYTLQMAGTSAVRDITRDMVRHESTYCKL